MNLEELYKIIEDRKKNTPKDSYVASLFRDGNDRIIQKVGEESVEVVVAAKNKNKQKLVSELADMWFHLLVLMTYFNIKPNDVYSELEKRQRKSKNMV